MPIFRFHRGSLSESLKTCVYVKNKKELIYKINTFNVLTGLPVSDEDRVMGISSYDELVIYEYGGWDKRIGWNTQIVLGTRGCSLSSGPAVIGFLSEPFLNIEDL